MEHASKNLTLVQPLPNEFEPLLLSTVEMLDIYWLQAAPLLQRCIDEAMNGEIELQDIYDGVKAGTMYMIVLKNDEGELPEVALALVLELAHYHRLTVMNVTALGGQEMDLFKSKFWGHVCSWAFMNGVRTMQASASPAMARILKGYGFHHVYATMRMDLTEM